MQATESEVAALSAAGATIDVLVRRLEVERAAEEKPYSLNTQDIAKAFTEACSQARMVEAYANVIASEDQSFEALRAKNLRELGEAAAQVVPFALQVLKSDRSWKMEGGLESSSEEWKTLRQAMVCVVGLAVWGKL